MAELTCPRCRNCGSKNLTALNAEMGFAVTERQSVYDLFRPIVCLECGFAEGFASESVLAKLGVEAEGFLVPAKCANCDFSNLKAYQTQIAFGRGLLPPVHIAERPFVTICSRCGKAEFSVPEPQVLQLRNHIPPQPPQYVLEVFRKRSKSA